MHLVDIIARIMQILLTYLQHSNPIDSNSICGVYCENGFSLRCFQSWVIGKPQVLIRLLLLLNLYLDQHEACLWWPLVLGVVHESDQRRIKVTVIEFRLPRKIWYFVLSRSILSLHELNWDWWWFERKCLRRLFEKTLIYPANTVLIAATISALFQFHLILFVSFIAHSLLLYLNFIRLNGTTHATLAISYL